MRTPPWIAPELAGYTPTGLCYLRHASCNAFLGSVNVRHGESLSKQPLQFSFMAFLVLLFIEHVLATIYLCDLNRFRRILFQRPIFIIIAQIK